MPTVLTSEFNNRNRPSLTYSRLNNHTKLASKVRYKAAWADAKDCSLLDYRITVK